MRKNRKIKVALICIISLFFSSCNFNELGMSKHEHTWDTRMIVQEYACGRDGIQLEICSSCGEGKYTVTKAKYTEHEYEEKSIIASTCLKQGKVTYRCKNADCMAQSQEFLPLSACQYEDGKCKWCSKMIQLGLPMKVYNLGYGYGYYYNQTLQTSYKHTGVDFMAEVGTEVLAAEDGTIESIYKDDLLSGTEIVVNHGNGLKTVYRFVTEEANVKVGDKVKKGEVIATVAEANGDEYKDGAHLHFEVLKNNQSVDPTTYLTLEEK